MTITIKSNVDDYQMISFPFSLITISLSFPYSSDVETESSSSASNAANASPICRHSRSNCGVPIERWKE